MMLEILLMSISPEAEQTCRASKECNGNAILITFQGSGQYHRYWHTTRIINSAKIQSLAVAYFTQRRYKETFYILLNTRIFLEPYKSQLRHCGNSVKKIHAESCFSVSGWDIRSLSEISQRAPNLMIGLI